MKNKPANNNALLEKRAAQADARAERAEVRRLRALDKGNQSEADGAVRTIEDAKYTAARLREQIAANPDG